MMCCANAVPRSKRSVTLVTRQPSFSSPTRFVDRHPRLVEEHLAEVALAVERAHRADLDARLVHVEDEPGDALVLRRVGVGAHEQLAVVGDVRARAPDLLAGHDVLVAVARRLRAQRREIGAGLGLGEALAPHVLALEDARKVVRPLRVGSFGDERRAGVHQADEVDADVRRVGARVLLEVHELLADRQPAAAELGRPGQTGVAAVEQLALPRGVVRAPRGPVAGRRRRSVLRDLALEPGAELGAEGFVGVAVAQVHVQLAVWRRRRRVGEERAHRGEVDLRRRGARQLVDDPDLRRQLVAGRARRPRTR